MHLIQASFLSKQWGDPQDRLAGVPSLEDMVRVTDGNCTRNTRHLNPAIRSILSFRYVQSALKNH